MNLKNLLLNLVRLVLAGLAFFAGMVIGGMLATALALQPPAIPAGMNMSTAMMYMMLTSPLLGLALAVIARGLSGRFPVRWFVLSFLMWIAYTVNTQLEASIFSSFAAGLAFTLVDFAVPALLCGALVAWLFPPNAEAGNLGTRVRAFFGSRSYVSWAWRLALAAIAFMPIYWIFGTMVVPFTGQYYQQNMYGLAMPAIQQIVSVLFVRSVLFLLACLPVIALWNQSARSLFLSLGLSLYILVGFVYMISADWMPLSVRVPHSIEILADEFTYAGVLVLLLCRRATSAVQTRPTPAANVAS